MSLYRRETADGRYVEVVPLVLGRARIVVGWLDEPDAYYDGW